MKQFIRIFASLAAFLVLSGWGSSAWAQSAEEYLKSKQMELVGLVGQSGAEADKKLTRTFDEVLDYDALAKNSLGDHWGKLSAAQQQEFQTLLTTLVQRAYTKNIRDTSAYDVVFKGENAAARGTLVKTVAKHKTDPRKEPIEVDYLAHKVSGKWRVFDIVTEGSSLVSNYKSQFRQIIEKKGFDGLIEKMKSKVAQG